MNTPPIVPRTPGAQAARLPSAARSTRTFAAILTIVALLASAASHADVSIDGLYDFRHVTDPQDNPNDFPVLELKISFPQSFGSFLLKQEIDLGGAHHNVSEIYTELSQSIKLGNVTLGGSPLLVRVGYSGGLGLFNDTAGGFYFDSRLLLANSLEAWTTSTAQALSGQGGTSSQPDGGKFASWELESEAWYRVAKHFYVGTYTRTTRNVYAVSNRWVVYPSVGVRYTFDPTHP
jgi:hypothetical protein